MTNLNLPLTIVTLAGSYLLLVYLLLGLLQRNRMSGRS